MSFSYSFCSHAEEGTMKFSSWPLFMGSPFPIAFLIFQCLTTSLIGQPGSFPLPAGMRTTVIALFSQFTLTQVTMDIMLPSSGLEEPSQSQYYLTIFLCAEFSDLQQKSQISLFVWDLLFNIYLSAVCKVSLIFFSGTIKCRRSEKDDEDWQARKRYLPPLLN